MSAGGAPSFRLGNWWWQGVLITEQIRPPDQCAMRLPLLLREQWRQTRRSALQQRMTLGITEISYKTGGD